MPSNVILITIDSLRADYRDLLDVETDPLSGIRDELGGPIEFSQAIANGPNTPSSFPSILTSTYPLMYGGYRYLDERRPFVAETFAGEGHETVAYHSNPHLGSNHNYDTGFGTFNDSAEGSDTVAGLKDRVEERLDPDSRLYSVLRRLWHYVSMSTDTSAYAKATTITDSALDWFEERSETDPFFVWLHYMDVHYPFTPPADCLAELGLERPSKRRIADLNGRMQEDPESLTADDVETLQELYLGELRFVDRELCRLFRTLEASGTLAETAVFVTSDHGEAFGEHGRFGHHPYMYDELLRVPLLAHVPGYDHRTVDQQVSLIDLGPTLYELCEVPIPEAVQGQSFEPLLEGESCPEPVAVCTSGGGSILACRTPKWKCLWDLDADPELYDLDADPDETDDVSDDNPAVVDRFVDRIEAHLDEADETDADLPSVEENDEVKQRLEDLGYVD